MQTGDELKIQTLLGLVLVVLQSPHSQGSPCSLNGLMSMKMIWIKCYDLCSHQISAPLSTSGIWTEVCGSTLHLLSNHQMREYLLEARSKGQKPKARSEALLEACGGTTLY